jgi:predicted nucleotidyltransferase
MAFYARVLEALSDAGVRYVVVGGVAVVMHGYLRMTQDVDVVVDLEQENVLRAVDTLTALGLRPMVPVDAREFANPEKRREWIEERNMKVFSMRDWKDPFLSVDLFVREPAPFVELSARAVKVQVGHATVLVAAIDDLIAMKREAGRPTDLQDIQKLEEIALKRHDDE